MTDRETVTVGRERPHPWRTSTGLIGQLEEWISADLDRIGYSPSAVSSFYGTDRPRVEGLVFKYTDAAGLPVYEAEVRVRGEVIRKDFSVVTGSGMGNPRGRARVSFRDPIDVLPDKLPKTDLDSLESEPYQHSSTPPANLSSLTDDVLHQFQAGNLDPNEAIFLLRNMPGKRGSPAGNFEGADPSSPGQTSSNQTLEEFLAELFGDDGPPGGGGGGPRYTAPDRSLVEDGVRGMLVQLVGHASPERLNTLTDHWMREDRRRFSGASVDPTQSVKNMIRGYEDYKRIHSLRPEQVDEEDWITSQAARLISAGVRSEAIDDRAIIQAQVGTPLAQAGESAAISELQQTKRATPEFFDRFAQAGAMGMRRVL